MFYHKESSLGCSDSIAVVWKILEIPIKFILSVVEFLFAWIVRVFWQHFIVGCCICLFPVSLDPLLCGFHHLLPLFPSKHTFRSFLFCVPGTFGLNMTVLLLSLLFQAAQVVFLPFCPLLPFPSLSLAHGFAGFKNCAQKEVSERKNFVCCVPYKLQVWRVCLSSSSVLSSFFPPVVGLLWPQLPSTQ